MQFNIDFKSLMMKYGDYIKTMKMMFNPEHTDFNILVDKIDHCIEKFEISADFFLKSIENAQKTSTNYSSHNYNKLYNIIQHKYYPLWIKCHDDNPEVDFTFGVDNNDSVEDLIDEIERDGLKQKGYDIITKCAGLGKVKCFKFLRSNGIEIRQQCLVNSIKGNNREIISECLENETPDEQCMKMAIRRHNFELIMHFMNHFHLQPNPRLAQYYRNLPVYLLMMNQVPEFLYNYGIPDLLPLYLSTHIGIRQYQKPNIFFQEVSMSTLNAFRQYYQTHNVIGFNFDATLVSHFIDRRLRDFFILLKDYGYAKEKSIRIEACNCIINKFTPEKKSLYEQWMHAIIKLLLQHGDDEVESLVNRKLGKEYKTLLMCAAEKGELNYVQNLIKHKAILDLKDRWHNTALIYAIKNGHFLIADLLISSGCKVNIKNKSGETPLWLVTHSQHSPATADYISNLLRKHGAKR